MPLSRNFGEEASWGSRLALSIWTVTAKATRPPNFFARLHVFYQLQT